MDERIQKRTQQISQEELNPRAMKILELILPRDSPNLFHCTIDGMFYRDSEYKTPLFDMDILRNELGIKEPEDAISVLGSMGYLVHSGPCYNCVIEQMAQS